MNGMLWYCNPLAGSAATKTVCGASLGDGRDGGRRRGSRLTPAKVCNIWSRERPINVRAAMKMASGLCGSKSGIRGYGCGRWHGSPPNFQA